MTAPDAIISMLPLADGDDPATWFIGGGDATWVGRLSEVAAELELTQLETISAIAIVPASYSLYRRVEPQGLEPQQELAVARLQAQERAIGAVQATASFDSDGSIQLATVDAQLLNYGIDRLASHGLMISAMVPVGAMFQPGIDDVLRVHFGGHTALISADLCCPDEPALASAIFGDAPVRDVTEGEIAQALVALSESSPLNFLDGMMTRRASKPIFTQASWKWAKRLSVLAILLFLAGGISYWAKLQWAIAGENLAAIAAAQKVDPAISDVNRAEASVDAALARKGIERSKPSMLVAILWQSTKAQDNVTITDMNLGDKSLLSATLSAPDTDSINAALLSIQRAGYQITATPRRDQSGVTLVDLTVRAP